MDTEHSRERGVIVVWMALILAMLLGCAAFAIDVTFWHLEHNREQRAADAAALAGAVAWPGDPTTANAAARDIASTNGYDVSQITAFDADGNCALGVETTRICAGPGARPFQYKVKVVREVDNAFGGIFGLGKTTVGATATGEYLKPLSMGSPSNQFGNDPDAISNWPVGNPPPPTYPNLWANIAGGNSVKQNGDAYAANYCDIPTDGCNGIGGGQSLDYKPEGYFYAVDFTQSATVDLQAFDPAFVHVGDFCDDGFANLQGASTLGNVPAYPQGAGNTADILRRYRPVTNQAQQDDPGYQYCTGDQIFTRGASTGPAPATTYRVFKATVPGDPSSAIQVCGPVVYPGFNGNLANALGTGFTQPGAPAQLSTYFRQWVTLCSVTGEPGDEYFIEVSTDAASQGHNRFSLRGVTTSGGAAPVTVAGNAYMGIYANVGTQLTQFHLARLPSAAAGHTLVLNFYDIGDAAAGSVGTLTIVPPPDSNVGSSFAGCQWTGSPGSGAVGFSQSTPENPWGQLNPIGGCVITGVNDIHSNWNAQWSTVTIPVPANYSCDDNDPNGCWIKINYQFTGGVNDTTSWNAFLLGDPVRLTQ